VKKKVTHADYLHCERCGELLKEDNRVWLELNFTNNLYYLPGVVPAKESQGSFPFGKTCAKRQLTSQESH
jgi:hypothetical protein